MNSTDSRQNCIIRLARHDDGAAMAQLFMRVWHTNLKDHVPEGFLDQFKHETQREKYTSRAIDPNWLVLVAESNAKVVGMLGATNNDTAPLIYKKQIKAMYVDPDSQSKGIGTALLKSGFAELTGIGSFNTMLWCISSNQQACSFYEKHGGKRIEGIAAPTEYSIVPHLIYAWEFSTRAK
jgi:GNAT superfamily N-acetyltransferase